jgi:hypothetical protein
VDIKNVKVIVSQHAIQRLKERFRNRFYNYFQHPEMTRNLIIAQVMNAQHLIDWKQTPFYVNKIATTYGDGVEIMHKSGVYYICNYKASDNSLYVKTCVPRILHYVSEPKLKLRAKP